MSAEKNKGGRPKITWDKAIAERVQEMSQYGTPHEEIAALVGISEPTLRKLYKKELIQGANMAKLGVRKKLYERCMAGDTACLIFYAKTQLGWKEDKGAKEPQKDDSAKAVAEAIANAIRSIGN